jgi:Leucine-rich repeat (LRR) protein
MNPNVPETENLWNLMGSKDIAHHALAFQVMKGLGMPAEIKTFLQEWRSFFQKTQKKPFSYMKVLEALSQMDKIVLNDSNITKLPQSYRLCHWVTSLNLRYLEIDKLPEGIFDMPLTHLDIFKMPLKTLPATIGKLQNLVRLQIVRTELEGLPATIGKLQNLVHLQIEHTNLEKLPTAIGELSKVTLIPTLLICKMVVFFVKE